MAGTGREGPGHGVGRRAFLGGAAGLGALVGGGSLAAYSSARSTAGGGPSAGTAARPPRERRHVPFTGTTQAGITTLPVPSLGLMAAFRVLDRDVPELRETLADLTDEVRSLMSGEPPRRRGRAYPPTDSGLLGERPAPDDLAITVAVGASLFDDRYGLADRRPRELVTMPFLANDRLDPARSQGDLLLSLEAEHPDTLQFALRQLMRRTRGRMVLAWTVDGYARGASGREGETQRNLMGFKDGTANLPASDTSLMDRYVWVTPDDGEPDWAVGGSYQAVRVIRMRVEFWDRTRLSEQEEIIGRHKISGAVLGDTDEFGRVDYSGDPQGRVVPLDAHVRLANPRTPQTEENLILRKGFSYSRGFDGAGQLDQGLAFVSFQRSLDRGFLAVQARLTGEPLEEYTTVEGGGFFFALPGVPDPGGSFADVLLA